MEIGFYSNTRKIEKNNCRKYDLNLRPTDSNITLKQARLLGIYTLIVNIWFTIVTFNVLKVSQSRAIIDRFCQDEGFELTYYIETLV